MLALIPAQQIVEQLQQQNIIDDYGNLREDLN
jgi:hypothetical protein